MTATSEMAQQKNVEKSLPELREMLQRQENLLANKIFIKKLPDKGEKIKKYREKLLKEITAKDAIEESCKLLSTLSIQPTNSEIQNLEWNKHNHRNGVECLDSDDDSEPEDPISIIASSTDVKKKIILIKPEKKLITAEDIKEIENFNDGSACEFDNHTKYICGITDVSNLVLREKFKPYQTSISNVHDPGKEILRKRGKNWEVTAATPPPAVHGPAKEISIQESLKLQTTQTHQLKDMQIKQASEKLASQLNTKVDDTIISFVSSQYREPVEIKSDSEEEIEEVYDDEPKEGGVVFTVTD